MNAETWTRAENWTARDKYGDDLKVVVDYGMSRIDEIEFVFIEITMNSTDGATADISLSPAQARELFDFLAQAFGEVNGP